MRHAQRADRDDGQHDDRIAKRRLLPKSLDGVWNVAAQGFEEFGWGGVWPLPSTRHLSDRVDDDRFVIVEEFADEVVERHGDNAVGCSCGWCEVSKVLGHDASAPTVTAVART